MFSVLLSVLSSLILVVVPVNSQYGGLGGGLLNSAYLQTGGLFYPNADGSGPQPQSLAAAIYGVAIPPGFNQFSASENFYGTGNDVYANALGGEVRPSDLLVGTGIHNRGNSLNGGDQGGSYSSFISDFSVFGTSGFPQPSDDLKSSSSSLIEIDPIAARFGVVISNHDHQGSLFHPSLSGTTESLSGGGTSTGEGTKDFVSVSPVETSIRFNLPSQVTLPESAFQFNAGNINSFTPGKENGLGRVDESPSAIDPTSNLSLPSVTDSGKNTLDIITSAFKFSDEQIGKTEELKRNFEQTTVAHIAPGKFEETDIEKSSKEESNNVSPTAVKQLSQHQSTSYPKPKGVKIYSKPGIVSKSNSPYTYRGGERERQQTQPSETKSTFSDPPENLPTAEYLVDSQSNREAGNLRQADKNENRYSYNFLTAPGYLMHK